MVYEGLARRSFHSRSSKILIDGAAEPWQGVGLDLMNRIAKLQLAGEALLLLRSAAVGL